MKLNGQMYGLINKKNDLKKEVHSLRNYNLREFKLYQKALVEKNKFEKEQEFENQKKKQSAGYDMEKNFNKQTKKAKGKANAMLLSTLRTKDKRR